MRSPHLAAGYFGDEKRTQEMFVINPFTNDSKDRMYKTGELGRYLPDGNVEWAGRNDRRVNIRGFRVELEEVESVLKQHPAVKNAAVVVQDYEISSPRKPETRNAKPESRPTLGGLCRRRRTQIRPLSIDGLRSFLSARLPDYMVPSHFVDLGPTAAYSQWQGRLSSAACFAEQSLTGQRDSFVAPRNDVEAKLCEIFSQVLGIEQVGVNDNFFRLGGHSLLAAQAAARIKEAFGVGLNCERFSSPQQSRRLQNT